LLRRNPQFVEAAVELHQAGRIPANSCVLDLDAIETNAAGLCRQAHRLGLTVYAMTKQIGRAPGALAAMTAGGVDGYVAVDMACARPIARHGHSLGHLGHLVQVPRAEAGEAAGLDPDYWTIFSENKAEEAAAAAAHRHGRLQQLLVRVFAEGDTFYPGHEGGVALEDLPAMIDRIAGLPGAEFAGLTTFPALLFDSASGGARLTPNAETLARAAEIARGHPACPQTLEINAPGTTSTEVLGMLAEAGATQVEPGHGLTGTTPPPRFRSSALSLGSWATDRVTSTFDVALVAYLDEAPFRGTSTSVRGQLTLVSSVVLATALWLTAGAGHADSLKSLIERLDRLEQENRQLRKEIDALKAARQEMVPGAAAPTSESTAAQFVRVDSDYGYEILDPTTSINRKQRLILERRKDGTLAPDRLHVQGAITAIANYQSSNRDDKFGYLMRHPTAANQVGDTVSEATIHSAQLGFTGTLGDWLTGHAVMLFDPEQSFGRGTNTDLERNQVQMRRAWALLGNPDRSPFYASLGKMTVPFGLTDTVSPFTASTVWHAFGALANGITVGYVSEGLNLSLMGIQGGAQFRAANTPVKCGRNLHRWRGRPFRAG